MLTVFIQHPNGDEEYFTVSMFRYHKADKYATFMVDGWSDPNIIRDGIVRVQANSGSWFHYDLRKGKSNG